MLNRILIVSVHPDTQAALTSLLQLSNFQVLTAANGQQALMKACLQRPDLIITEAILPKMDGIELVRQLRSCVAFLDTPIIVATAYMTKAAEAIRVGADDVLPNPLNPGLLILRINALL